MEEYTRDASGSYLREDSCYFFRIDEKTLFWQKCQNRVYLQSEPVKIDGLFGVMGIINGFYVLCFVQWITYGHE